MDLKDRLKQIRKDNKLSQSALGKLIGISSSQIACYETGYREITDRAINDICRELNINETWLRTGEGEMYVVSEQDEELAEALAEISLSDNEKLKKIVQKLTKLNDKEIDTINDLIDLLLDRLSNN